MATVIPLPSRAGAPLPPAHIADFRRRANTTQSNIGEYRLADVARRLCLLDFGIRTIVDHLRIYAAKDGMPLPRNKRIRKGEPVKGPLVIYSKSVWDAGEFDAWLDGDRPAGGSPAAARPLPPPMQAEMAARAAQIASAA